MNFVNRHFPDREVTDRISPEPTGSRKPKWPLRYDAVEHVVLGADIATILLASLVSTLLYQAWYGQGAANVGNALGLRWLAQLVSFAC
ncbi:hypothetical protein [Bradyrhizobium liaoningense]|uniref:hypothetical protein n=1 Tax=Bradyrhizobium liaoningense TaxID=43992 RepID=UPI001FCBAB31|nr:hypothetical protein [Bradyrhizobium liaoningense]WLB91073.1 hypothetical protein QIH91_11995 [Bradyrhizobium japonicum USDA 135]GLR92688.1 hypothetical protein GCM10007858_03080 [Bradyrhizobium liaoningense]